MLVRYVTYGIDLTNQRLPKTNEINSKWQIDVTGFIKMFDFIHLTTTDMLSNDAFNETKRSKCKQCTLDKCSEIFWQCKLSPLRSKME